MKLIAAAVCVACIGSPVYAHEFYPPSCCGGGPDGDCYALEPGEVEITAGGYRIRSTGEVIPYGRARVTPPEGGGSYHRCSPGGDRSKATFGQTSTAGTCFWAPTPGG